MKFILFLIVGYYMIVEIIINRVHPILHLQEKSR